MLLHEFVYTSVKFYATVLTCYLSDLHLLKGLQHVLILLFLCYCICGFLWFLKFEDKLGFRLYSRFPDLTIGRGRSASRRTTPF